jgi:hypothetical protein
VTPDGVWRVEVIRTRGGEVFRVRRLDRRVESACERFGELGLID